MTPLVLALALLALAAPGEATPITFRAIHVVDSSSIEGVRTGDLLETTFTLDPAVPDADPSPRHGRYAMVGAGTRLGVVVTGDDFSRTLLETFAYVVDVITAAQDQVSNEAYLETHASDELSGLSLQLVLAFHESAFPDDRLPTRPPDLDLFRQSSSRYLIHTREGEITGGEVRSLDRVGRVSEPGAAVLLALGASGLLIAGRRTVGCARRLGGGDPELRILGEVTRPPTEPISGQDCDAEGP